MKKAKSRFGFMFLAAEVESKKQRRTTWTSQKSMFHATRERVSPSLSSRLLALSILLAVLAGVYFKFR